MSACTVHLGQLCLPRSSHAPPHGVQPAAQLDFDSGAGVSLLSPPGGLGVSAAGKTGRSQVSGPIPTGETQILAKLHLLGSTSPGAVCAGKQSNLYGGTQGLNALVHLHYVN